MNFALDKMLSNLLSEKSFWERYETEIIIGIVLFVLITVILIAKNANRIKSSVYNRTHVKVVMQDHKDVFLKRGERFIPPIPNKNGVAFGGWFIDTALTIPWISSKVRHDIAIYPKWIKL